MSGERTDNPKCESCERDPCSKWCRGCIIEDYQAQLGIDSETEQSLRARVGARVDYPNGTVFRVIDGKLHVVVDGAPPGVGTAKAVRR